MYPGVKTVKALPDYKLQLTFDSGEQGIYDVRPLLEKGHFKELRDIALFNSVRISFDTVVWSNGVDLCPEMLYEDSMKIENR
ncbi:MAG: DUF2442 domain-containing protein [Candidatus Wallbacteria bacterium]|nr:DUF2442 domain-containing protein [Candidatus Wallbacteria bacterium]